MHSHLVPQLILLLLLFLGAIMMMVSTAQTPWVYAEWVKIDFWISGSVGMFVIVLKLTLLFLGDSMSPFAFQALNYIRILLLGVPTGLIVLFVLSGEFGRGFGKKAKDK